MSRHYTNMDQLKADYSRVTFPKPKDWRVLPPEKQRVGEINALDMIRGQAVATNGIHVALLTATGTLDFGHLQWFIPDAPEPIAAVDDKVAMNEIMDKVREEYI